MPQKTPQQTTKQKLRFSLVPGSFAVCRLAANAAVPAWALRGEFFSVTRTSDELSIACAQENVPSGTQAAGPWSCFKLLGPFAFELTGVLSSVLEPLAANGISIFAISTYDTDYVLVREESAAAAIEALHNAGHELVTNLSG